MRVAVTGATGLIGRRVVGLLREAGCEAIGLKRADGGEGTWNVETGEIQTGGRVDAVVHLAGRNIAARWTKKARAEIWDSRVTATEKLCGFLAKLPAGQRPELMISTSAVGIYGDRGDEVLTEGSAVARPKVSFLADVCRAWETATRPAEEAAVRVIHLRLGVVLSKDGGALAKLLTPTKMFLGGPVGRGTQWMSWISLTDVARLILHLATRGESEGTVNAVAPNPVRQHEFMRTLGKVVRRPTVFPLPAFMVKLAFGQMGQEALLASQRVAATRIPRDFQFTHKTLEEAMRSEIERRS